MKRSLPSRILLGARGFPLGPKNFLIFERDGKLKLDYRSGTLPSLHHQNDVLGENIFSQLHDEKLEV
jgi:hypothetical protein